MFTPGVIVLLVLMISGIVLYSLVPGFTVTFLAVHPRQLLHGRLWQMVTYSLINDAMNGILHGMVVFFIGGFIEREWRTRSFLGLCAVISIGSAVVWSMTSFILGRDLTGMSSAAVTFGLIAAFGLIFRDP